MEVQDFSDGPPSDRDCARLAAVFSRLTEQVASMFTGDRTSPPPPSQQQAASSVTRRIADRASAAISAHPFLFASAAVGLGYLLAPRARRFGERVMVAVLGGVAIGALRELAATSGARYTRQWFATSPMAPMAH